MNETENLSVEQLEKIVSMLENKANELEGKMESSKNAMQNNAKMNLLTVAYATICGFIVDYKAAIAAALLGGVSALAATMSDGCEHTVASSEYIENRMEMHKYESALAFERTLNK